MIIEYEYDDVDDDDDDDSYDADDNNVDIDHFKCLLLPFVSLQLSYLIYTSHLSTPSIINTSFCITSIDISYILITHINAYVRDTSNILACIPTTNIFIEAGMENGGVLVHCFGGMYVCITIIIIITTIIIVTISLISSSLSSLFHHQ